jgi:protease PrsW
VAHNYAEHEVAPYGLYLGARYALFGLGGHAAFTAIFGASLGLAIQTRRRWLRLLVPIGGLALAIAAHMLNNALPLIDALASAAAGEPPPEWQVAPRYRAFGSFLGRQPCAADDLSPRFVALAGLAIWRSGVWERRVIREELAGVVGRTVTGGEYRSP